MTEVSPSYFKLDLRGRRVTKDEDDRARAFLGWTEEVASRKDPELQRS